MVTTGTVEVMHKEMREKEIGWFKPVQSNKSRTREKEIVLMTLIGHAYQPSAFMISHSR